MSIKGRLLRIISLPPPHKRMEGVGADDAMLSPSMLHPTPTVLPLPRNQHHFQWEGHVSSRCGIIKLVGEF